MEKSSDWPKLRWRHVCTVCSTLGLNLYQDMTEHCSVNSAVDSVSTGHLYFQNFCIRLFLESSWPHFAQTQFYILYLCQIMIVHIHDLEVRISIVDMFWSRLRPQSIVHINFSSLTTIYRVRGSHFFRPTTCSGQSEWALQLFVFVNVFFWTQSIVWVNARLTTCSGQSEWALQSFVHMNE